MKHIKRLVWCIVCMSVSVWQLSAQEKKVSQWERFEVVLHGSAEGNPFSDVSLYADFWQQEGDTVSVQGFYDGDGRYIIRFMPAMPGVWHYATKSNLPSLAGKKGNLKCVAAPTGNHGPVRVKDTHNFMYADGMVYYPLGTTAYAWIHMPQPVQEKTLLSLEKAGFNKLRMCVFPKNYGLCKEEPEIYPFLVAKYSAGKPVFDFTHFNPAFFRHLEKRIGDLKNLGIEADLILFHPYDKGRWGFDSMPMETNVAYVKYLVARLSSFSNVWWSLANEYDYVASKTEKDWKALIRTVVASDPYRHLCSIHGSTATYFPYWMEELTHASIQDEAPVEDFGRASIVRNIYRKPVVFDEVCYEGNLSSRWGRLSGPEMLHRIWQGLIAGTYVTHGECYQWNEGSMDTIFWAKGGEWRGESWKRIVFTRSLLNSLPQPLQLADVSRDHRTATAGDNYYLIYFGRQMQDEWLFSLPAKNASCQKVKSGTKYKVEIIDTWNMTVTEYPRTFEVGKTIDYRHYDVNYGKVRLPLLPYLMLRVTALDE